MKYLVTITETFERTATVTVDAKNQDLAIELAHSIADDEGRWVDGECIGESAKVQKVAASGMSVAPRTKKKKNP
jgi:hypothetical protein